MTNKKSNGKRQRTRSKFKRSAKPLTIRKLLQEFPAGSKVHVHIDSSVHSGLPDKRFQGLTGTVMRKQGQKGVVVSLWHGNALKTIIVHAAHLAPLKEKALAVL